MTQPSPAARLPEGLHVFERGWLSSNNILLIGPNDNALVDSGYVTHAGQTLALVQRVLGSARLDRIVTTHVHSDHCGGNALLQQTYGSETWIPHGEAELVRGWREEDLNYRATGQQCDRFGFDSTYASGDLIEIAGRVWQALGAPGHDPHSMMLYCPAEEILISADALWEKGFGVIFPELEGRPGFDDTRRTLQSIAQLPVRLVIPGHGAPFTDIAGALQYAFDRLDYLEADPRRNAQHALKVLLKFQLLEHQAMPLDALPRRFAALTLVEAINTRFMQFTPEALCDWVCRELVRSGAASVAQGWLRNTVPSELPSAAAAGSAAHRT